MAAYTLAGISYWEDNEGSGVETLNDDPKTNTAQRVLRCAWNDRYALVAALKGYTTVIDGAWVRFPGQSHPSQPSLWPDSIAVKPLGKPTGFNSWVFAVLTVSYVVPKFDASSQNPEDFITRRMKMSYDVLQIPGETTESSGGGGSYKLNPDRQIIIPKSEYDLTLHHANYFPFQQVIQLMGVDGKPKVNASTFEGAAAGHLLFLGADADQTVNTALVEDLSVTYHFLWSPQDHRKDYDPQTDTWVTETHKVSGETKYTAGDFSVLFKNTVVTG